MTETELIFETCKISLEPTRHVRVERRLTCVREWQHMELVGTAVDVETSGDVFSRTCTYMHAIGEGGNVELMQLLQLCASV